MSVRFPMPPGVVGKVLKAAADPDGNPADLGRILQSDAVLSAQVLRAVNAASYGLRHKVGSVDRAVVLMGVRAVRNLVLTLCLRDLVPTRSISGFSIDAFWESSLRRAAGARCIAERLELPCVDEFFTMGLCQDIGLLMLLASDSGAVERLTALACESSDERIETERSSGSSHDETSSSMFAEWGLPDEIVVPVRFHHRPGDAPEPFQQNAFVAHAAEALADLSTVADKQTAIGTVHQRLATLGLDERDAPPIVQRINELVDEFASLLGLNVSEQPTYEEIVAIATTGLVELNCTFEEVSGRLQSALVEQQRMAAELERINRELDRQARTDSLTGLPNRRAFDEALLRELAVVQRQGGALSLLIIDIDHFKRLNDRYGHVAGDLVLSVIGKMMLEKVRMSDALGRIGGEEFAIILPFTEEPGARIAAERYREAIEGAVIPGHDEQLRVTASFGGATIPKVENATQYAAAHVLRLADEALYEAKSGGRNRVCWSAGVATPVGQPVPAGLDRKEAP